MDAQALKPLEWDADHIQAFVPSVLASPWGPLSGVGNVLHGACLFEFTKGDQAALVAVKPVQLEHGLRLDVVGLVGTGRARLESAALCRELDKLALAMNAQQLAMTTQVPHVARGATRNGWTITGAVLTKPTKVH
jgi:hypothetical protein